MRQSNVLNSIPLRLLFQAFERLVRWHLLFVLSPLAFVFSFLPQTASMLSFWGHILVIVAFTQLVQFLIFALGLALLVNSRQGGFSSVLLAMVMLFLVAKIPGLFACLSSMSVQEAQGIDRVIGTIIIGARLA